MNGWFLKFWKSKQSSSIQHETDTEGTKSTNNSESTISSPLTLPQLSSLPPQPQSINRPSTSRLLQSALDSELRWKRKYDVFMCHSAAQSDVEEATQLVSFLEASPCSLRCFLWQRDTCPGGAVFTEFCQALQNSHVRILLITPNFVKDDWCLYMMHQALAEGPMSNRMIPLIQNLDHFEYPQELKFYYYTDLSKNPHGYTTVNNSVLHCLEDLFKKEIILDSGMSVSSSGFESEDKSMTKVGLTGKALSQEVVPK